MRLSQVKSTGVSNNGAPPQIGFRNDKQMFDNDIIEDDPDASMTSDMLTSKIEGLISQTQTKTIL